MARRTQSYRLDPQRLGQDFWFYEDRKGLLLVHDIRIDGRHIRTDEFTMPWRMVIASAERHKLKSASRPMKKRKRT